MPTTTNFGWTTPADTDLVKDGALAIRTLGNGIDTSLLDLKGGTTGQVLSKASNTDLDFTWVAQDDSNAIQNAIVDAKGDLISATAADTPARLAVGTNGQVLTADSTASTGLKWATPASGGKVLQVVSNTYATSTSVSTTTWTDTGLSASITPSATTSKILVLVSHNFYANRASNYAGGGVRLLRGSTKIYGDDNASGGYQNFWFEIQGATNTSYYMQWSASYLDSPATTSSTTYKSQISLYTTGNSHSITAQPGNTASSIILLEIGA